MNNTAETPEIMIFQSQELMVSPPTNTHDSPPSTKLSHFLKPSQNPTITPHPISIPQSQSLSPNPQTFKNLTKIINFKGIKVPNDSWKTWVYNLIPTHETTWKKAGIFDAIRASTYNVKRDDELIIKLAHYWCPETNTFVFPWGECTITLEDVMVLGGFSVLGECVVDVSPSCGSDEINALLVNSCSEIKRKNNYHVPFYDWIKYFKGRGGELEHVGLIVNWFSRYVFCVDQFDIDVGSFVYAISLAQGKKIALAPAVLASIYRDLSLLKNKIVACNGGVDGGDSSKSKLVLWSPMQLVQLWAWERFPALSPKPKSLALGEPRIARWDNVAKLKIDWVNLNMESGVGIILWRPYAMNVENWELPKFYSDEGKWVVISEGVGEELVSFARCLRNSELVGMDCLEQYLPHRVGMQFGMDQDIPDFVPRLGDDTKLAWSGYDKLLDGVNLYLPPRLAKGDVTVQYSKLWRRMSPLEDVAITMPEKRKRKREGKSRKGKIPTTGGEPQLCSSEACNVTSDLISFESGQDMSARKLAPFRSRASEPASVGDVTVATGTTGTSDTVVDGVNGGHTNKDYQSKFLGNLDSQINSSVTVLEDLGSQINSSVTVLEDLGSQINSSVAVNGSQRTGEPLQGSDTEKMCILLSEEDILKYRAPFDSLHMKF